jgi:ABC-type siderophore export system fused ATPase/permease subunit
MYWLLSGFASLNTGELIPPVSWANFLTVSFSSNPRSKMLFTLHATCSAHLTHQNSSWTQPFTCQNSAITTCPILTFVGPCILIYFYSKTKQMHNISNLFYFVTTLYMFRTVFPSVIRSLRLYIQHQVYFMQVLWLLLAGERWNCSSISLPLASN